MVQQMFKRIGLGMIFMFVCLAAVTVSNPVYAVGGALPAGFSRVLVGSGLTSPTAFAFLPNHSILVAERAGTVRVIQPDGTLRATPYATLNISYDYERGLLGIAVDPKYNKNHYVYVYYATAPGSKHWRGTVYNRVSRLTTKKGVGTKEHIIIDNIPSDIGYHNGGDLHFGFDGKLYVTIGDGGKEWGDAAELDNLRGKILRVNRDGNPPPNNPFYNTPGAMKQIFALGFREPFRLTPRPANSTYLVGEVGFNTWEEINSLQAGADYGWWRYEGPCPYNTPACDTSQTNFGATTAPIHYYNHGSGTEQGNAVVAGAFAKNSNYPPPWDTAFFYADFVKGWVHTLTLDNANHVTATGDFDTVQAPTAFGTGPDGNVYILSYGKGEIYKYVYSTP